MAGTLGKYQISPSFTSWKGLTSANHLGTILRLKPQKATDIAVQLMASYRGKSLETFLSKFPKKSFDSTNEYTWDVVGSNRRNIALVEARREDGTVVTADQTENVGIGIKPFYVVFAEDWFADGEQIVGELNEIYPLRILEEPRNEGTNYVYKVELLGGVVEGMPVKELLAGKRFSADFAPVEMTLSREVGDIRFTAPTSMRNEFSVIRIKHKIDNADVLNKKVMCGIPFITKEGKKVVANTWMHYVDLELESQFSEDKNLVLTYGRTNRTPNGEYLNIGKSKNVIKMGAGFFQQCEYGNRTYYTNPSLKLFEDKLLELCTSKLDFNNRKLIMTTGERGALQFHKLVSNSVQGWGTYTLNADSVGMVEKVNSPLHKTALAAGFQFVEYRMPNGITIALNVDPLYDDPIRNKIEHPLGGPAMSYRYDIFDMGTTDQPNIFKCTVNGLEEQRGYQWGPFSNMFTGQTNNMNASYDEDSAVIHKKAVLGICVLDPTRTMSLIPNILRG